MAITLDGTTGATVPAVSDSGNLTFTGTGNRITGDFSNATLASRVMFQSSTANAVTAISAIPNGSGTVSTVNLYNANSFTNYAYAQLQINASETRVLTGAAGSGTALPLTFYTQELERMRIDTSGNVGIGVTPNAWSTVTALQMAGPSLWGSSTVGHLSVNTYFDGTNYKYINTDAAMDYYQLSGTHVWRYAASGTAGTNVTFSEAMRIDSSGNLLVGATSSVNGGSAISVASGTVCSMITAATASTNMIVFRNGNGNVGSISTSGTATAFNTGSDYRLKHDVEPMTTGLATVSALKPVTYKWNADNSDGEGFIAHELQTVIPHAVTGEKDAIGEDGNPIHQGVDYSKIVVHLVAAIQELSAEVEALKAKVGA